MLKFGRVIIQLSKFGRVIIHKHIDCAFAYKVVCTDARFSKRIKIFRGNNAAYEFVRAILEEFEWCKKVIKKYFNKKGRLKRNSINFK